MRKRLSVFGGIIFCLGLTLCAVGNVQLHTDRYQASHTGSFPSNLPLLCKLGIAVMLCGIDAVLVAFVTGWAQTILSISQANRTARTYIIALVTGFVFTPVVLIAEAPPQLLLLPVFWGLALTFICHIIEAVRISG